MEEYYKKENPEYNNTTTVDTGDEKGIGHSPGKNETDGRNMEDNDKGIGKNLVLIDKYFLKNFGIKDSDENYYIEYFNEYIGVKKDLIKICGEYEDLNEFALAVEQYFRKKYKDLDLKNTIQVRPKYTEQNIIYDFLQRFSSYLNNSERYRGKVDSSKVDRYIAAKLSALEDLLKKQKNELDLAYATKGNTQAKEKAKLGATSTRTESCKMVSNVIDFFEGLKTIEDPFLNQEIILNVYLNIKDKRKIKTIISTYYQLNKNLSDGQWFVWFLATTGEKPISKDQLNRFKETIIYGKPTEYSNKIDESFKEECDIIGKVHEEFVMPYLTERYKHAEEVAELRGSYGDSPIFLSSMQNKDSNNPSGQQIAAGLLQGQNSRALDSYKISDTEITDSESSALRYTAFDVAFSNEFNQNDSLVKELVDLKIDLRSELSNYGIYNYETTSINEVALGKFEEFLIGKLQEKLKNSGLSDEEIQTKIASMTKALRTRIENIPAAVEENYKILCGNFHSDSESFEKIAKIHALGEIIENIKKTFNEKLLKDSDNLGKNMGLELDKENPAEIVGDCLFLKGKFNGTDVTIKYDLSSGKLFMNSFIQTSYDKISIGNTQPHTQIGRLDSFGDILEGYNPAPIIQPTENTETGYQSNESEKTSNSDQLSQETSDQLVQNKLVQNLKTIGAIVRENAENQAQKNLVVTNFLKTFNIIGDKDDGKMSSGVDFTKESNLYNVLEIINNTTNTQSIEYFDKTFMPKIMNEYCGLKWGENNPNGYRRPDKTSEDDKRFDFTFDEKNQMEDAVLLRNAARYFSMKKSLLEQKGKYDQSHQLGFANLISNEKEDKRITSGGKPNWKLDTKKMEIFIKNVDTQYNDWFPGLADEELTAQLDTIPDDGISDNNLYG